MPSISSVDQLNNTITINSPPQRIISLVPSQTELLFDIGLEEQIAGITRFCIHPADKVRSKEKVGGTKRFQIDKIKQLEPDLIIGNKEENYKEGIEELQKYFPVWMSDIYSLEDSFAMMKEVSRITNRLNAGEKLIAEIKAAFINWQAIRGGQTAAYFVWRKPYLVAASNTFIDYMLNAFGLKNVFHNSQRYPEIQPDDLSALKPDFIFLSSEPYAFSEKHFDEFRSFSPGSKVVLVDGEMFSWYGSRLRFTPEYFGKLKRQLER